MNYLDLDEKLYNEFLEYFKDTNIPDPEQYPLRFKFLVKTFLYHKSMEDASDDSTGNI